MAADELVDAADIEVIRKYLTTAAKEMERSLIRTAYNAIVYEVKDFAISIYDDEFALLADSPGNNLFLGANDYAVKRVVEYVGRDAFDPGDVVLTNYPYWSSRHPNDAVLVTPVFHEGEIVAFPVVRAHWVNIGEKDEGYVFDSTDVHQEGLLIPGLKLYRQGEPNQDLLEVIRYNTRSPTAVMGDMNAQLSALMTGRRRIEELYEKYGAAKTEAAIEKILEHGRTKADDAVAGLPNGSWTATDYLDTDGINGELVPMEAAVTVGDGTFEIDLSGSADEVDGPFNVPIGLTQSFCKLCFKAVTTPTEPSNGGQYDPLSIVAPEGNLFNAQYPAPTYALSTSIAAIEVVFKAITQGMPDRLPASTGGDVGNIGVHGTDPETGETFLQATNEAVGWGALADHDGNNALMHLSEATQRNLPVEVWEQQAPVRINRLELRTDSGGAGEFRGGLGVRRDYEALEAVDASSFQIKTRTEGWGIDGGDPGAKNAIVIEPDLTDDDWADRFTFYVENSSLYPDAPAAEQWVGMFRAALRPGEIVSNRTGGGGGYGDPFDRAPERVLADVQDGYVTREAARKRYGVVIADDGTIDRSATDRLREQPD